MNRCALSALSAFCRSNNCFRNAASLITSRSCSLVICWLIFCAFDVAVERLPSISPPLLTHPSRRVISRVATPPVEAKRSVSPLSFVSIALSNLVVSLMERVPFEAAVIPISAKRVGFPVCTEFTELPTSDLRFDTNDLYVISPANGPLITEFTVVELAPEVVALTCTRVRSRKNVNALLYASRNAWTLAFIEVLSALTVSVISDVESPSRLIVTPVRTSLMLLLLRVIARPSSVNLASRAVSAYRNPPAVPTEAIPLLSPIVLSRVPVVSITRTLLAWPVCLLVNTSRDRKSTRLNSSHHSISYAVFCLKKKK